MYGWFHIIEELAERDITKFKSILDSPASTIFAHISYRTDYKAIKGNSNIIL